MSERKVSTDALETLGTIIDASQKRDAIHLAVLPVEAGEALRVGIRISIINGKAFKDDNGLSIVDPFLEKTVKSGQMFWAVLRPRLVQSLRHVWSHPDFEDEIFADSIPKDLQKIDRSESKLFIKKFMEDNHLNEMEFEYFVDNFYEIEIDSVYIYGTDIYGSVPQELLFHIQQYTGKPIDTSNPIYFTCSC